MSAIAPDYQGQDRQSVAAQLHAARPPVVIVGSGPVGVHVARELLRKNASCGVVLYGDEPWEPYNRVMLSSFLAGDADWHSISNVLVAPASGRVDWRQHCAVTSIDIACKTVADARGRMQPYSALVLATGSRPHTPQIPGIDLPGVYNFRDMSDAQKLMARRMRSRHTVILGGGLLGLETARAMQRDGTRVTVIDHSPRLMGHQLDNRAGELLHAHVLSLGIGVLLARSVRQILGENELTGIVLADGQIVDCDTLVVATGIRPNIDLARAAGLSVGRGIRVDDHMRTSAPDVYAVGECSEHRGNVYGLVAPGLEQAAVAADRILGGNAAFPGSIAATELKVVDYPVFSMGRVGEEENPISYAALEYANQEAGVYRKVVLRNGRLAGAIALGGWDELGRLREAIQSGRRLWFWQRYRFASSGRLWAEREDVQVAQWPASATVCNCRGVTRGELSNALSSGATSIVELARCTGASSVCGSCKPLLAQLIGACSMEPVRAFRALLTASLIGLLALAAFVLLPRIGYADTVQSAFAIDVLWRDGLYKQVSGYTLLGLSVLVGMISLRKRVRGFGFGGFDYWRLFHVVVSVLAVAGLVIHTGLRLGHNFNMSLMLVFLGLMLAGATASTVIATEHRLSPALARRLRRVSLWTHILLFWPVPALLGIHILKVYYF